MSALDYGTFSFELQCGCMLVCEHMQVWCVCTCMCAERRQPVRVTSPLSPFQYVGLRHGHGHQAWWQASVPFDPSHWPKTLKKREFFPMYVNVSGIIAYCLWRSVMVICCKLILLCDSVSESAKHFCLWAVALISRGHYMAARGEKSCAHLCPNSLWMRVA